MAMTQLALLFMGIVALAASMGFFINFDEDTRLVVTFLAVLTWLMFGFSAFDVIVTEGVSPPVSEPIMPLVFLGFGLTVVTAVFWFHQVLVRFASETESADLGGVMR